MNIGEKIAELRRDAGMTQEVLASRLVISPQAVSKWERGVANPDLELIPEIARLFGVSADELLGLSSSKARENELESRIGSLERLRHGQGGAGLPRLRYLRASVQEALMP